MVVYDMFQTEVIIDKKIKINLLSSKNPDHIHTFDVYLNISTYSDQLYHSFIFGRYYALSKSQWGIQLKNHRSWETIYVTPKLLSTLMLEINSKSTNIKNEYLKTCLISWETLINDLNNREDFSQVTEQEPVIKPTSEVIIYIPEKLSLYNQETIVNACGEFMEALGFEMKTEDEPIYNSFWQKIKFIFKRNVTEQDIHNLFDKGKKALELKYVELPTAEQTEKLAGAVEKVLNSIENFDNCTIRLGSLLIVKRMPDGVPSLNIHQLTLEEIKCLEENNSLLKEFDPMVGLFKLRQIEALNNINEGINQTRAVKHLHQTVERSDVKEPSTNEIKETSTTEPILDNSVENMNKDGGIHGQTKL